MAGRGSRAVGLEVESRSRSVCPDGESGRKVAVGAVSRGARQNTAEDCSNKLAACECERRMRGCDVVSGGRPSRRGIMNNALHGSSRPSRASAMHCNNETRERQEAGRAGSTPLLPLIGYNPPRSGALLPDAHRSHLHVLSTSTFGLFCSSHCNAPSTPSSLRQFIRPEITIARSVLLNLHGFG